MGHPRLAVLALAGCLAGRIGKPLAETLGLKTVAQAISGDPTGKNRETIDIDLC